eukprot:TRINITY_DN45561_c0_g1_i1.p1 TRINITY_DN45561_c0_g1~~TRINITY_DN45561_c0_g1_i1.p1  ORF type:complete len:684 (+),score=159.46 TRINITY_DN45561_c0_g1_i1:148-2199(+)
MLQGLGSWGSDLLDQAGGLAGSGVGFIKSGANAVKGAIKENVRTGSTHTFKGKNGNTRVVTETKCLAEGGFGAVYLVRDSGSNKEYALKKIRCQDGVQVASTIEAAENEAKVMLSLPKHPHIVRCLGFITKDEGDGSGWVNVLLELCRGGHLLDYLDSKNGTLNPKEIVEPMVQICDAVHFLHSQSPPIQHRDLKVENVLKDSVSGDWKLCDFGSCSTSVVPAKELTRKQMMELQDEYDKTVTMLYRPPEMAAIELNFRKGYEVNTQVDVWMIGCILYTVAFYRHPFQDNANAMAICNAKYFIPPEHPMAKSQKLCALIHWLLAPDPKDRPTSKQILEVLRSLGQLKYPEIEAMLPEVVHEKMRKLEKMFTARRDTGDITLDAFKSGGGAKGARRAPESGGGAADEFGMNLNGRASAAAVNGSANGHVNGNHNGGYNNGGTATGGTTLDDLLAFNSPSPSASTAPAPSKNAAAAPAGGLLDFDLHAGGSSSSRATGKSAPAVSDGLLDFNPSAAPMTSTTSANVSSGLLDFNPSAPLAGAAPSAQPLHRAATGPPTNGAGGSLLDFGEGGNNGGFDPFGLHNGAATPASANAKLVSTPVSSGTTRQDLAGDILSFTSASPSPDASPSVTSTTSAPGSAAQADFAFGFADFSSAPPPPVAQTAQSAATNGTAKNGAELDLLGLM